jgi:AcrR family transcriptional regulator
MGVDQGAFRCADALAVKALLGMHHYSYLWLRPTGQQTAEDIGDTFTELALNGIRTGQPSPQACSALKRISSPITQGAPATGTPERVRRVAAELFASRGFHGTGMSELGRAAGLGRGALYHHITSKEELLFDIASRYLRSLVAFGADLVTQDLPPEERLRALSRGVMRTVADHLPELTVCFREAQWVTGERRGELGDLHARYQRVWATVLRMGVDQGAFRCADALTVKALLGMHHYSYLWLRPTGQQTAEDIGDTFTELALNGLRTRVSASDA